MCFVVAKVLVITLSNVFLSYRGSNILEVLLMSVKLATDDTKH